ncbi:MAG: phosphohistidine phosphatase SixA [Phycisphaerales bacterium]|nr:MAG: phosphohistidine phosphatase SixA [Phycisphaerales bacterium]
MKLYLVQHGAAVPKEEDPDRPLSETGAADVRNTAAFLARAGVRASVILHSGKTRAAQTAERLAASVGAGDPPETVAGIAPLDPTSGFAATVNEWAADTIVVGHLPFLGKLVSRLIAGNEAKPTVTFRPGGVVCLERDEGGSWSIAWMMRPELLRGQD